MALGAVLGFLTTFSTGNHALGFVVAALGGAAISMVLALGFRANQVVIGVAA